MQLIREQMMTTGSVPGKPGFSSKADAKGPTAGYDPVIGKVEKRKRPRYIWLKGVDINPGQIVFTFIFFPVRSTDNALVKPSTPLLAAT